MRFSKINLCSIFKFNFLTKINIKLLELLKLFLPSIMFNVLINALTDK